jgi:hypothetical protein
LHVNAEDVELYARRRLSGAERKSIDDHIAGCPPCRSKVAAAIEYSQALSHMQREAAEMRDSHRVPTDDPATIQVLNPRFPEPWDVRIRNVSTGGMCVRTPRPIDRGTQVKVRRGNQIASGEIRYCVPVGEVYHVGILVSEVVTAQD